MTNRRPIEPPPIMMALPSMGENRRHIIYLSFLRQFICLIGGRLYVMNSRHAYGVNTPWLFCIQPAHDYLLTSMVFKPDKLKVFYGNE